MGVAQGELRFPGEVVGVGADLKNCEAREGLRLIHIKSDAIRSTHDVIGSGQADGFGVPNVLPHHTAVCDFGETGTTTLNA